MKESPIFAAPSEQIWHAQSLAGPQNYLYLKRMNHDLHQHLLIRKQTVQIQTLTLYSLQYNQSKPKDLNHFQGYEYVRLKGDYIHNIACIQVPKLGLIK